MEKEYIYDVFKTLSDPTRLQILGKLSNGELCAGELLEFFQISQPTLSYHIKLLDGAGLINTRKDGKWSYYTINKDKVLEVSGFMTSIAKRSEKVEREREFENSFL